MAARLVRTVIAAILLAAGASSCSATRSAALGTRVLVVEHDFGIVATPNLIRAGLVTFHIDNHGPSTHELILDHAAVESESLPLQRNGLQVNEDDIHLQLISELSDIRVGTSENMTVQLVPGHYVLFCNLEGHYLGGMRLTIEVKE